MKILNKVIWAEGILLGQQHLQKWDDYHQFLQKELYTRSNPINWGLSELDIDETSLINGVFHINNCCLIYPDGTFVKYDRQYNNFELSSKLENEKTEIFLCIPSNQKVSNISGYDNSSQNSRWKADYKIVKDDYDPDREREVLFGELNLKLLQSERDDHYSVKIAELDCIDNRYSLNTRFIPTCMNIKTSSFLEQMTLKLINIVNAKISVLKIKNLNMLELKKYLLLQTLNSAFIQLKYIYSQNAHPCHLFSAICNLISGLSIFGSEDLSLINYNHYELKECFKKLNDITLSLLDEITPKQSKKIKLQKESESLYLADIDDSLFDLEFFLEVRHKADISWIENFISQIKICAKSKINQLIVAALPGMKIKHLKLLPEKIPIKPGYEYFYLDSKSRFWEQIKLDKGLAVFLPHDFLDASVEIITV